MGKSNSLGVCVMTASLEIVAVGPLQSTDRYESQKIERAALQYRGTLPVEWRITRRLFNGSRERKDLPSIAAKAI
jgi:hypothetical protein